MEQKLLKIFINGLKILILSNKTMNDKLVYIINDDKQNHPFFRIKSLVVKRKRIVKYSFPSLLKTNEKSAMF